MRTLCLLLFTYVSAYEYGFYIEEGHKCLKRTGEKGICTHFSKCPSAIEEVRKNGRPEICSFAGIFPIVCCLKEDSPYSDKQEFKPTDNFPYYLPFDEGKTSLKKCRDYHSKIKTSHSVNKQAKSIARKHPHMAVLGVLHNNNIEWKCSGALISERFVITAAHCMESLGSNHVRLGDFDVESSADDADTQDFRIGNVYLHPKYDVFSGTAQNIALVQLDRPAKFTDFVRPACLGITKNISGTFPETAGWELDYENPSYKLKTHYLKYISNGVCDHLINDNTNICAGNGASCDISYGSPLQITNFFYKFNSFPEIIGIVNTPESCDERGLPGTYTKVQPYLPWIEGIVWAK